MTTATAVVSLGSFLGDKELLEEDNENEEVEEKNDVVLLLMSVSTPNDLEDENDEDDDALDLDDPPKEEEDEAENIDPNDPDLLLAKADEPVEPVDKKTEEDADSVTFVELLSIRKKHSHKQLRAKCCYGTSFCF